MKEEILKVLSEIEEDHKVEIIFAAEAGSQAWGIESHDSDFDVRFIYKHPLDWYLSIDNKRDVIEQPGHPLDVCGWDLKKAFRLFRAANPPINEWLRSPFVYLDKYDLRSKLSELQEFQFNECRRSFALAYLHMADGNYRKYLEGKDKVWHKKYLYSLRGLMASSWIENVGTLPPVPFIEMIDQFEKLDNAHREHSRLAWQKEMVAGLKKLLERKQEGDELGYGKPIEVLHRYLKFGLSVQKARASAMPKPGAKHAITAELNEIFQGLVK